MNGRQARLMRDVVETPCPPANGRPGVTTVVVAGRGMEGCSGLRVPLSPAAGFRVVELRECNGGLLEACHRFAPCVLVADRASVAALAPAALARVSTGEAPVRILVTGPPTEERWIEDLLRLGCMGFLPADSAPALWRRAVRAVERGELWMSRSESARAFQQLLFAAAASRLTRRESEILALIAEGDRNRTIAGKLAISHETVRWHIRSLHAKLGMQDRLATALYARQYLARRAPEGGAA